MKRILVALFLLALVPRLWALDWGLPYVEHPDEPALVETAVRMVQERDWNPRRFMYPSLYFYLLVSLYDSQTHTRLPVQGETSMVLTTIKVLP